MKQLSRRRRRRGKPTERRGRKEEMISLITYCKRLIGLEFLQRRQQILSKR